MQQSYESLFFGGSPDGSTLFSKAFSGSCIVIRQIEFGSKRIHVLAHKNLEVIKIEKESAIAFLVVDVQVRELNERLIHFVINDAIRIIFFVHSCCIFNVSYGDYRHKPQKYNIFLIYAQKKRPRRSVYAHIGEQRITPVSVTLRGVMLKYRFDNFIYYFIRNEQ